MDSANRLFVMRNLSFPQYRKYANNRNFFKILSASEFEEISFIGAKALVRRHQATILPDRNLIADLLHDPAFALTITEIEYQYHLNSSSQQS